MREELLADQLEDGYVENCDIEQIRRLRHEFLPPEAPGGSAAAAGGPPALEIPPTVAHGEIDNPGSADAAGGAGVGGVYSTGGNIDLLERLLAGR